MNGLRLVGILALVAAVAGCNSFSFYNVILPQAPEPPKGGPLADTKLPKPDPLVKAGPEGSQGLKPQDQGGATTALPGRLGVATQRFEPKKERATFVVDGKRGNEKVLFFLALSGGGSRAAYLSAATMLKLQTVFDEVDLLQEVDVISSVSGGSLTGGYYAVTRDETLRVNKKGALSPALEWPKDVAGGKLQVDAKAGTLQCKETLTDEELGWLRTGSGLAARDAKLVETLCAQAAMAPSPLRAWNDPTRPLRAWNEEEVKDRISRDYLMRWFGNWFWPHNIVRYWFTAYDRSDIMAQTLEDNLFDTPVFGTPYTFMDANPYRPYIIINATNATGSGDNSERESFPFGTVFAFTKEDFRDRLRSDIRQYSVARAVMGSSAFPFVFPSMTLRDFRKRDNCEDESWEPSCARYLHVFDGGNSDNLGLKSVKRALFEMAIDDKLKDYDHILVLLVDAFTMPAGARSDAADSRSLVSRLVDTNFIDAVDSLLQANRAKNVAEFHGARLGWSGGECETGTRSLPISLCADLDTRLKVGELDLGSKLVFYHFGFDDVRNADLKRQLDAIPTSFSIDEDHVKLINQAVAEVIEPTNPCLQQMRNILKGDAVPAPLARKVCHNVDILPKPPAKQ